MGQIPAHIQYQDYASVTRRRRFSVTTPILIGMAIGLAGFVAAAVFGLIH